MQFAKSIQLLCEAGVDYVVIGGLSSTFHGSSQITYDLDICYSRESANLQRLVNALAPFSPRPRGFPPSLPFVWDETTLNNGTIFTLQTTLGEIDLLAEVSGIGSFPEVRTQSIEVEVFGLRVLTLDLPGLIKSKRAAGREKDLSVIPELESLLESRED